MAKYKYDIMDSNGRHETVIATQRQIAIEKYLLKTGMPRDFFNAHCKIKNLGRAYENNNL